MTRKKRGSYFAVTLTIFILMGALGLLVAMNTTWIEANVYAPGIQLDLGYIEAVHPVLFALCLAYAYCALLSSAVLFGRFIAKRGIFFQILCTLFFPLTLSIAYLVGFVWTIPYSIYNFVRLCSGSDEQRLPDGDVLVQTTEKQYMV